MLIFVIIFNLGLTIVNVYVLLKIRQWTKNLKKTTEVLSDVEVQVDRVLNCAPEWVMIGQKGTKNFHLRLGVVGYQLEMVKNLLNLVGWLMKIKMGQKSSKIKIK